MQSEEKREKSRRGVAGRAETSRTFVVVDVVARRLPEPPNFFGVMAFVVERSYAAIERFFAAAKAKTSAQHVEESHKALAPRRRGLKKKIGHNRPFNPVFSTVWRAQKWLL